jgi:hypothetical protein
MGLISQAELRSFHLGAIIGSRAYSRHFSDVLYGLYSTVSSPEHPWDCVSTSTLQNPVGVEDAE